MPVVHIGGIWPLLNNPPGITFAPLGHSCSEIDRSLLHRPLPRNLEHSNSRKFHHTVFCSEYWCCAAAAVCSQLHHYTTDYTTDYSRPPARDHRNHRRSSHIDINNNTVVNLLHILHWEITYMIYQNIRRNTFSTQKYFLPLKCILLYDVIYISLNSIDNGARDVLIKAHCYCQLYFIQYVQNN